MSNVNNNKYYKFQRSVLLISIQLCFIIGIFYFIVLTIYLGWMENLVMFYKMSISANELGYIKYMETCWVLFHMLGKTCSIQFNLWLLEASGEIQMQMQAKEYDEYFFYWVTCFWCWIVYCYKCILLLVYYWVGYFFEWLLNCCVQVYRTNVAEVLYYFFNTMHLIFKNFIRDNVILLMYFPVMSSLASSYTIAKLGLGYFFQFWAGNFFFIFSLYKSKGYYYCLLSIILFFKCNFWIIIDNFSLFVYFVILDNIGFIFLGFIKVLGYIFGSFFLRNSFIVFAYIWYTLLAFVSYIVLDLVWMSLLHFVRDLVVVNCVNTWLILKFEVVKFVEPSIVTLYRWWDVNNMMLYYGAYKLENFIKEFFMVYITEKVKDFSVLNLWLIFYYKIAYLIRFVAYNYVNENNTNCVWCLYNYHIFFYFYFFWFIFVLFKVDRIYGLINALLFTIFIKLKKFGIWIKLILVNQRFIAWLYEVSTYFIGFYVGFLGINDIYFKLKSMWSNYIVIIFSKIGYYIGIVLGPIISWIFPESLRYENGLFTKDICHVFFLFWMIFVFSFSFYLLWGYGFFEPIDFSGLANFMQYYKANIFLTNYIYIWKYWMYIWLPPRSDGLSWFIISWIIHFFILSYLSIGLFVLIFCYFEKNKAPWLFFLFIIYICFCFDNFFFFQRFFIELYSVLIQIDYRIDELYDIARSGLFTWIDMWYTKYNVFIEMIDKKFTVESEEEEEVIMASLWYLSQHLPTISDRIAQYCTWFGESIFCIFLIKFMWKTRWFSLNAFVNLNSLETETFKAYLYRMMHLIYLICLWFVSWYLIFVRYTFDIDAYLISEVVYVAFLIMITHMIDLQALIMWSICAHKRGGKNMHNAVFIWCVHVFTTFIFVLACFWGMGHIFLIIFEHKLKWVLIAFIFAITLLVNWNEPLYTYYVRFCNRVDFDDWAKNIILGTIDMGLDKKEVAAMKSEKKSSITLDKDWEIWKSVRNGKAGYKRWMKDKKTSEFMRNEPAFKQWKIYTFDGLHIGIAMIMAKTVRENLRKDPKYANKNMKICVPATPQDYLLFYDNKWEFLRITDKKILQRDKKKNKYPRKWKYIRKGNKKNF